MRLALSLLVTLSLAACADDSTTPTGTPKTDTHHGTAGSCVNACRVALDLCGSTEDDRALVQDCAADCPFSESEWQCLTNLSCGDNTSACY